MNVRLIAEICAGIAVIATIVRMVLDAKGIKLLRDIRDQGKNRPH
ncbi:MAG: hypothetical protein WBD10_04345 [Acidobacteriaceae bacterium]